MTPARGDAGFRSRRRRTFGTIAFLVCVGLTAIGVVVAAAGGWRQGTGYVGVSLLLACLTRFVLPDRHAGLLRVRRKAFDVALMGLLGLSIVVFALLVPDLQSS
ncbi:MAG: DUF3017 domain-containing protein [Nocardioidaceae bacterium]